MLTWSDPTFVLEDAQRLQFTIHDVPFIVHSNDADVLAHVARLVQRYRVDEPLPPSGPPQVLIAAQGTPTIGAERLTDVPRRAGGNKPARVATADIDDGRVIVRRETGSVTTIQPDRWVITGDLRANPGEVTRALDAMLSLALVERGYLTLKGSALARAGRGLALVGGPDGARRALAVTLVAHGFQWVTEDLLLVRVASGHVEMRGLPGLLRLGPAAMLAHPALRATLGEDERARYEGKAWRDLRDVETRYVLDTVDAFGPAGIATGGILQMIVALRWRGGDTSGTPAAMPISRADAYEALAEATRSFGLYDLRGTVPASFHRLQRIAETVAMRAVTGPVDLITVASALAADEADMAIRDTTPTANGAH
jgi:HprK-related kinase B